MGSNIGFAMGIEAQIRQEYLQNGIYPLEDSVADARLEAEQVFAIFTEIFTKIAHGKTPEQHQVPVLSYVGAQPGAGKSGLINKLQHAIFPNSVYIEGDAFRPYHPNFLKLNQHPESYIQNTQPFSAACVRLSIARCIDHNYNILLETTMRNLRAIQDTIQSAKQHHFKVDFHLLIVRLEDSYLGTIYRNLRFQEEGATSRVVTPIIHHEAYVALHQFVQDTIIRSNPYQIDSLTCYNRHFKVLERLNFHDSKSVQQRGVSLVKAIENELHRVRYKDEAFSLHKQQDYSLQHHKKSL